ncbi:MAG: homoserine dehydrogenase [Leptospirales bacterium]|nr:homoserine dehydrogenase [Leptospirales bacterium]
MKTVTIGIIGFGTVGRGVFEVLSKNGGLVAQRTGIQIKIASICDNNPDTLRPVEHQLKTTAVWQELVDDPSIDIIVELIGGLEPAGEIILSALKKGKSVVTANKKLLAERGGAIFGAAAGSAGLLRFEAAVGGGIPCLLALSTGMAANRIKSIIGILNGTTNYILSRMERDLLPFDDVLKEAQQKGFAEADPSFDINGFDAGHKISILAMLAYGKSIDYTQIAIEGISRISKLDIKYAKDMGYIIKLLGIARMTDDLLDISVHLTMLPEIHPLASVRDEFNAIMIDGDMTAPILLYGKGAGSAPTASAVISDIIQIASEPSVKMHYPPGEAAIFLSNDKRVSKYYLRLYTKDQPGILSKITGILGQHSVSIASLIQRETSASWVPLIFTTHSVNEASMMQAVRELNETSLIKEDMLIMRIED